MNFLLIFGALIVIGAAIYILRAMKDVPGSSASSAPGAKPEESAAWEPPEKPVV